MLSKTNKKTVNRRLVFTDLSNDSILNNNLIKQLAINLSSEDSLIDISNDSKTDYIERYELLNTLNINYMNISTSSEFSLSCGSKEIYKSNQRLLSNIFSKHEYLGESITSNYYVRNVHDMILKSFIQSFYEIFNYCNKDSFKYKDILEKLKHSDELPMHILVSALELEHLNEPHKYSTQISVEEVKFAYCLLSTLTAAPIINSSLNDDLLMKNYKKNIHFDKTYCKVENDRLIQRSLVFMLANVIYEAFDILENQELDIDINNIKNVYYNTKRIKCNLLLLEDSELEHLIDIYYNDSKKILLESIKHNIKVPLLSRSIEKYMY
jgi:6-phosphogluconate dehydrogenase (decarboxylating)